LEFRAFQALNVSIWALDRPGAGKEADFVRDAVS
jgi:hypothetical protein